MQNFHTVKDIIFSATECAYTGEIDFVKTEGVYAEYDGTSAKIGGPDTAAVCRALTEFSAHFLKGENAFCIRQERAFRHCGVMLDLSRDGAMRVDKIKEYIRSVAALGLNVLMLYLEDLYPLKGYSYFGYQRGAYTAEELREIDDYAAMFGIETVPCIQTLGHMERYLGWAESAPVRDTSSTLLPDAEETYRFIEDCIRSVSACFRSPYIHIGMDEALGIGTGVYFKQHAKEGINQTEVFLRHLNRVCAIAKQYGRRVMIWSDLFFSMEDRGQHGNYDEAIVLSEETLSKVPDLVPVYWYYSSKRKEKYAALLKEHRKMSREIAFAGAGWSFETFAPNTEFAWECNAAALAACREDRTDWVINTLWGDSGSECSPFLCMPTNALYAEFFYSGALAADEAYAWEIAALISGCSKEESLLMSELSLHQYGEVKAARRLLRKDVLNVPQFCIEGGGANSMVLPSVTEQEIVTRYRAAAKRLEERAAKNPRWAERFRLIAAVMQTAADKCVVYTDLQKAYQEDDREKLTYFAEEIFPRLKTEYQTMQKLHETLYLAENKAFGWGWSCLLYGQQLVRIDYATGRLSQYLNGEITEIEELRAPVLNQKIKTFDREFWTE